MELRNCPQCGRVFRYTVRNLCPDCYAEEEKLFERVRDYLADNPGAKLDKVEQETGVPADKILKWLKEGRLIAKGGAIPGLECERCGSPIETGRLCSKCSRELEEQIKKTIGSASVGQESRHESRQDRNFDWVKRRPGK